jgi:protein involved in polysaccharide export with SLBB domain
VTTSKRKVSAGAVHIQHACPSAERLGRNHGSEAPSRAVADESDCVNLRTGGTRCDEEAPAGQIIHASWEGTLGQFRVKESGGVARTPCEPLEREGPAPVRPGDAVDAGQSGCLFAQDVFESATTTLDPKGRIRMKGHLAAMMTFLVVSAAAVSATELDIQPGDVLSIMVEGHEELSKVVTVDPRGMADYLYLKGIPLTGRSTTEVQQMLTYKLASVIHRPVVYVTIPTTYEIEVSVLGQVEEPGVVKLSTRSSIQEALRMAGGPTEMARLDAIKLVREVEGTTKTTIVNVQEFMSTGDPFLLAPLRDGDKVIVPGTMVGNRINVMGAVANPGFYYVAEDVRLLDVLTIAGGFGETADREKVWLVSSAGGKSMRRSVDVEEFFETADLNNNPKVYAGDNVFVPARAKGALSWEGFMKYVRDLSQVVLVYWTITRIQERW